jgi:predicted nucleic acid-binding protein
MSDHLELIKVFFDSDVLIAGSASRTGASFLMLQLCELGMLKGLTCDQVIEECRRNIQHKLPQAEAIFEKIVENSVEVYANLDANEAEICEDMAHPNDSPILAVAVKNKANYLVTFNTKHFYPDPKLGLIVCKPRELVQKIRALLNQLLEK